MIRDDIPQDIGLIFIDGDHSYEAVKFDFDRFSPWLTPSGIVVFHDAHNWRDVSRFIGTTIASSQWVFEGRQDDLVWIAQARFQN